MSPISISQFSFRSLVYYTLVAIGVVIFIGYVIFQARFMIVGPHIVFKNEPPMTETSRTVTLEGKAYNIVKLTLDGRPIFTDKNGHFKEALVLENGYTVATLQAVDRYGRRHDYTKQFVYTPALSLSK